MKRINGLLWMLLLPFILITGCKKESTELVSAQVKVSFPEITLNGPAMLILTSGATYTDAGAKLKDDITGAVTDITATSGNVNTAVPGLYVVSYIAANSNGFETSVSRLVAVAPVAATENRAGVYKRTATGINSTITKLAEGVYEVKNPAGFGGSPNTIIYMVETSPNVYVAPAQPTDFGTMSVININFTAAGVSWNVVNPGFGTGSRVFIKQ